MAETIDLRDLIMSIKEQKQLDANLSLEFDCRLDVEDYKPLVKVINYAINYVHQLQNQPMQISLNAGGDGYMLGFTAFTDHAEFPSLSEQAVEACSAYQATLKQSGEAGKYVKILMTFKQ
jgi:hypothetical protein